MQFANSSPDIIRAAPQRWLLNYWQQLRGPRSVPLASDIVPDDLSRFVENLMFCDVVDDESTLPRLMIRYRGRRITEVYGECDGKYLDETMPELLRETAMSTYRQSISTGLPVYSVAVTRDRDGRPVDFERLLLPFSRDGQTADRILTALEWFTAENGFASRHLLREQQSAPEYIVCTTITV